MTRFAIEKWTACALAALVVGGASAQVTASGGGYLFRAKYVKGKSATYTMKTAGTMQAMKIDMTMSLSEKILSVANGVGTIQIATGKSNLLLNGKPFNQPIPIDNQKRTVKLDALGKTADGGVQTHIELPKNPIKIGSSWTVNSSATVGPGQQQQVRATYKLIGFENVQGKRTAKLGMTLTGSGGGNLSGKGTLWILAEDCSLLKQTGTLNIQTQGMTLPMSLVITRK